MPKKTVASKKKDKVKKAVVKDAIETNETDAPKTNDPAELTEKEKTAVKESNKSEDGANTERLESVTSLVSKEFNLDEDYSVTNFDDKGKVVTASFENDSFMIKVTVKDSGRHPIVAKE